MTMTPNAPMLTLPNYYRGHHQHQQPTPFNYIAAEQPLLTPVTAGMNHGALFN